MGIENIDAEILSTMKDAGLDTFDAERHDKSGLGSPNECTIMVDTLEVDSEYGTTVIQSGARVHFLPSQAGEVDIGDYFTTSELEYVVESLESTQVSGMRAAHCRVVPLGTSGGSVGGGGGGGSNPAGNL